MKSLLLSVIILATFNVSAKSIRVHTTLDGWGDVSASFEINADLGRAWVNLEIDDAPSDPDSDSYDKRVKIEGLSYEVDTKEVIYTSENGIVTVCSQTRTRGRGIFRNTRMKNTQACFFEEGKEIRSHDDGFYVSTRKYQTLTLVINE
jgi:hypothetical protein